MMPVALTLSPDGDNFILVLAHFIHESSHDKRILALRKLMDACRDNISDLGNKQGADGLPFKGMVVCPEYFFADFNDERQVSGYPSFPGTLLYQKALDRPDFAGYKLVKSGKHTGERKGELKTADRRAKVVQKMHTALSVASSGGIRGGLKPPIRARSWMAWTSLR